jgi:hypothetical protein
MADLIGIAVYLGVFGLICWAVYSFLPPSPPKPPKVSRPRPFAYVEPRESVDAHLTRGLITILLLDLFCGPRDH